MDPTPEVCSLRYRPTQQYVHGFILLTFLAALAILQVANAQLADASETEPIDFPRVLELQSGDLILYEPQIESVTDFREVVAWSAALYAAKATPKTYGSVKFKAKIAVDTDERIVTLYDREVLEIAFPGLDGSSQSKLKQEIISSVNPYPGSMLLDAFLGYIGDQTEGLAEVQVLREPPEIYYRDHPALLLGFDSRPVWMPVENSEELSIAVNTNWDLFWHKGANSYSLHLGNNWLSAPALSGPWRETEKPPLFVSNLPSNERWQSVKNAPPNSVALDVVPEIVVSTKPSELIVTNGAPEFETFGSSGLSFVKNSSSDIIFDSSENAFYFLSSGRWFRASSLQGPWQSIVRAPEKFKDIPTDHERAHVRAAVAGTPEASLAVAKAQLPVTATVTRDTTAPDIVYAGEGPIFEQIDGTSVYHAKNTTADVFLVDGYYYYCLDGVWFRSVNAATGWTVADSIPADIYDIPPSSPAYHVTYVTVYDSTPDVIYVGYTPGYHHHYVSFGVVVYGSGYYWGSFYDPFYYHHYPYWYYHYYPRTYGAASFYRPATGTYAHGHYAYGPGGGYWEGRHYNPRNGRYGRGQYAWDYNDEIYRGWSYNPRTDVSVATRQQVHWYDSDTYDSWGETVIARDDRWVRSERYSNERGFLREIETSEGGTVRQIGGEDWRAGVIETGDGDLYAGINGSVFRRSEDGDWQRNRDGEWTELDNSLQDRDRAPGSERIDLDSINTDRSRTPELRDRTTNDYSSARTQRSQQAYLDRSWEARTSGRQRFDSYRRPSGQSGRVRGRRNR